MGHVLIECNNCYVQRIENALLGLAESYTVQRTVFESKRNRDDAIGFEIANGRAVCDVTLYLGRENQEGLRDRDCWVIVDHPMSFFSWHRKLSKYIIGQIERVVNTKETHATETLPIGN